MTLCLVPCSTISGCSQDDAGVQARKLVVDGQRLPWLVGLAPCDTAPKRFYSRSYRCATTSKSEAGSGGCTEFARGGTDTREWSVTPLTDADSAGQPRDTAAKLFTIKSLSTGRCLTLSEPNEYYVNQSVVLLPCNQTSPGQRWGFGKGIHSPSSIFSAVAPELALAIGNDTLFSASYGKDAHMVPSAAYGDTTLTFSPRVDQQDCTSRNCQNYDNKQMWYYDPTEQLLRATTCGLAPCALDSWGFALGLVV
eukprot:COSAG02_NODE_249_length_27097_cov_30.179155_6_plen_252_part_00